MSLSMDGGQGLIIVFPDCLSWYFFFLANVTLIQGTTSCLSLREIYTLGQKFRHLVDKYTHSQITPRHSVLIR